MDAFSVFIVAYVVLVLLPCFIAGSSALTSANDEIEESD
jgi:hypothetical protein